MVTNPYTPPDEVVGQRNPPNVAMHPRRNGLRRMVAAACWVWMALCAFWFFAAVYELVNFTVLRDAYGPNTPQFRASYAGSAVSAVCAGFPAVVVLLWLRYRRT